MDHFGSCLSQQFDLCGIDPYGMGHGSPFVQQPEPVSPINLAGIALLSGKFRLLTSFAQMNMKTRSSFNA